MYVSLTAFKSGVHMETLRAISGEITVGTSLSVHMLRARKNI